MVFPVVTYRYEHQRIDAFELWCWRRLLRVPWIAKRSNQSILKEISPEYSLEGLMLKLKLQFFGHLMWRTDSLEKTLMLGKIKDKKRRGRQRMTCSDSIPNSVDMNLSQLGTVEDRRAWSAAVHRVTKTWVWLSYWVATLLVKAVIGTLLSIKGDKIHPISWWEGCQRIHLETTIVTFTCTNLW